MDDERIRELTLRAQTAIAHSKELAQRIADLAERSAVTEDHVAEVHENLTGSSVDADRRRAHAEEAREFAAHERRESERWRAVAEADGRPVTKGPEVPDPSARQ